MPSNKTPSPPLVFDHTSIFELVYQTILAYTILIHERKDGNSGMMDKDHRKIMNLYMQLYPGLSTITLLDLVATCPGVHGIQGILSKANIGNKKIRILNKQITIAVQRIITLHDDNILDVAKSMSSGDNVSPSQLLMLIFT